MKKLVILILIWVAVPSQAQEASSSSDSNITTYYLIRHAEKDRSDKTNRNPDLTKEGQERAKNWAALFEKVDFDLIYSTQYTRTLRTAAPTAMVKGIDVQSYLPRDLYNKKFRKATAGKTVLVVGHSNTTPAFVNAILGEKVYEDMDDTNNGSLYIVTVSGNAKKVQILSVN